MAQQLSEYMMRFSKFEFLLMRIDSTFVQTNAWQKVVGVQWEAVAGKVNAAFPWATFDFASSGFEIFRNEPPQYLTLRNDGTLAWDSDLEPVGSGANCSPDRLPSYGTTSPTAARETRRADSRTDGRHCS